MNNQEKLNKLFENVKQFYMTNGEGLLFHGWHHINFVTKKSIIFAQELHADIFLVQASALTHDLNYAVKKNSNPDAGSELRIKLLKDANFSLGEIDQIEKIILEEDISTRDENISLEAKALSDADTLFKALPITPIIFSSKYIEENNIDLNKLTGKIIEEQIPLIEKGIYFYSNLANEKYLNWAKIDLELWKNVQEVLKDDDVNEMLNIAKELKYI